MIQTQRCHLRGLTWCFLTFPILLKPSPPWKLVTNRWQRLMSLMFLHRAQCLQEVRAGGKHLHGPWCSQGAGRIWHSSGPGPRCWYLLPSSQWWLSQDRLLLPHSESQNNCWLSNTHLHSPWGNFQSKSAAGWHWVVCQCRTAAALALASNWALPGCSSMQKEKKNTPNTQACSNRCLYVPVTSWGG